MAVADRVLLQAANRAALRMDVVNAVQDVRYEGSMESAPTLHLPILDPDRDLLNSHLLVRRAIRSLGSAEAFTLRVIDLVYQGLPYRLSAADPEGEIVTLEFEHRGVAYMREQDHPISASRAGSTRAMFIRRQVREVGKRRGPVHRMAFWAPEVRKRQPIAAGENVDVSARAEPERDVAADRESARGFRGLTIKGVAMDADQRRNVATALGVAEEVQAGPKATLAMLCAGIAEAAFKTVANAAGSGAFGPFQVMPATARAHGVSQTDVAAHARIFLVGGKGSLKGQSFTGGDPAVEIARKNPGISPGAVANMVEGGGAGAAFYEAFRAEAEKIMGAGPGVAVGSGSEASGTGGSYVKPYQFRRDKGEDAWENTARLAEEVGRRRFVTVVAPRQDVFMYGGDADFLKLRPQAAFSPDDPEVVNFNAGLTMGRTARTARLRLLPGKVDLAWGLPIFVQGGGVEGGKWLVWDWHEASDSGTVEVELRQPQPVKPEPASEIVRRDGTTSDLGSVGDGGSLTTQGGAKGLVDSAFAIAKAVGGEDVFVVSAYRPGDPKDHGSNDADKAARDIAVRGIDALVGPPSPKLDRACVALGEAFGRPNYGNGTSGPFQGADTFQWKGYRVQIIWRTPAWGGHMGHIHIGCRLGG